MDKEKRAERNMKCYLINLDRAPERLERMTNLLTGFGVDFERISAIDGQKFTDEELGNYRSELVGLHSISPGDMACGASHLTVLQRIADGNSSYAAIMEDDMHLSNDIGFYLNNSDWIPADADIVKLETFREVTTVDAKFLTLPNKRRMSRLLSRHWGTGLYIVSKKTAQSIIKEFTAGRTCIDNYIFDVQTKTYFIYQVYPALAVQDNVGRIFSATYLKSDIADQRENQSNTIKLKGFAKLARKPKRFIGKVVLAADKVWHRFAKRQIKGLINFRP